MLALLRSSSRICPSSSSSPCRGGGKNPGFNSRDFEPDALHVGLNVLLQILLLLQSRQTGEVEGLHGTGTGSRPVVEIVGTIESQLYK